jgi:RNA polymerase sigma factor (sigma-70 family)
MRPKTANLIAASPTLPETRQLQRATVRWGRAESRGPELRSRHSPKDERRLPTNRAGATTAVPSPGAHDDQPECDSTLDVLDRARRGDTLAARVLIERTLGPLRRWARGRLPFYARAGANTDDVVQDAVLRALGHLDTFEHRTVGGLQAYLRESVRNRIRDEVRRVSRRGVGEELPESLRDGSHSPLEQLILKESSERYVAALRTLRPEDRLAIIYRLEHRHPFDEIARKLGKSSPDAARMAVTRSVRKLAEALGVVAPVRRSAAAGAADRGGSGRASKGSG